jgi:hypothetical protein
MHQLLEMVLASWICDNATSGGGLILLSFQANILSYYFSMFLLNKTFVEKLTKHMRTFFGNVRRIIGNIIW